MAPRLLFSLAFSLAALLLTVPEIPAQDLSKRQIGKMLRKMEKADQACRNYFIKHQTDSAKHAKAVRRMIETDSLNYPKLKKIFNQCGYPTAEEGGGSASFYFWLLVQHQDRHPQFQDSVLTAMKPLVDSAKISGALYAYLLDRVNLNTGKLQVYGTQVQLNKDSSAYEIRPCEDPAHVNERRKSVGLGPIEVYLESFNKDLKKSGQLRVK